MVPKTGDLEELSVPGGLGSEAYELDRRADPKEAFNPTFGLAMMTTTEAQDQRVF